MTAGGSMGSNAADVADARQNLSTITNGRHVFFSTADVGWCSMSSTVRRKAILISHWGLLAPTLRAYDPRVSEISRDYPS